jgi:hypothetical protein
MQELLLPQVVTLPSPSYTYTVAINGATAVATSYTAAVAGEYVFTVTDANNTTACTVTTTITVEAIPTPQSRQQLPP